MHKPIEAELGRGLHGVTAPPELWDCITSTQSGRSDVSDRRLVWAMAAIVTLATVALSSVRSTDKAPAVKVRPGDSQLLAFHCQNSTELRAWVKANAGLDAPSRSKPPASPQLIGALQGRDGLQLACKLCHLD